MLLALALFGSAATADAQAVPILGSDAAACHAGATNPAILVVPVGMKDRKGLVRVELYPDDDDGFLQDDKILIESGRTFRRVDVKPPPNGPFALCIRAPRAGRYSMMLLHDRDANRKFGMFVDGAGLPGNPPFHLRRPHASEALITVGNAVTTTRITLNYWRGFGFRPVRSE